MSKAGVLNHSPFVPYDEKVVLYGTWPSRPYAIPWEYTGWRDESLAWKSSCYIHGNLNPSPTWLIKGPDALKFLSSYLVNGLKAFEVGMARHGIMCRDDGILVGDGVLLRTDEDEFISQWMAPYIAYVFDQVKDQYDAKAETLTNKVFLFQIAGPKSLAILEKASGDKFRDIKFMHHRMTSFNGMPVRILRLGMAGTLSYELHGDIDHAHDIYNMVLEAGKEYGIRRLGYHTYMMNHTEDGFPQAYYHFPYPWAEDEKLKAWLGAATKSTQSTDLALLGSMGPDIKLRYRNPVELGWERAINFNHEFVGKEALQKLVAEKPRTMVTLEWNKEDIIDIYRSQFEPGEPYANMDRPYHFRYEEGRETLYADRVLDKDGSMIGISSGRAYSYHYRQMISLCSINTQYSELGTEVFVLWGNPGTRQKKIRAVVARFPYLNEARNEDVDVSKL